MFNSCKGLDKRLSLYKVKSIDYKLVLNPIDILYSIILLR